MRSSRSSFGPTFVLSNVETVSEQNIDTGTQNEMCVFHVGSLFAHTRINWTLFPVGRGEYEEI